MTCDICGSTDIVEIRCKIVCRNCGTILQSCADLGTPLPLPPTAVRRPPAV